MFVGVAPKADLLIVKVRYDKPGIGDSPSLVNALDWIWDHPRAAGKAVVINISQGNNYGPHDGTSLVESAIDIDLLTAHGRAVVKSAGNEGDTKKHAAGTVLPHDKLDITFEVRGGDAANRHLEIWYGKANTLKVTVLGVVPPGGQRPTSPTVSPNDAMQMWPVVPGVQGGLGPTFVKIVSRTLDGRNSDSCIELDFLRPAGGVLPAGEWLLRLENPDDQPAPFDCWFERAADGPTFTSHETRDNTITAPGTSKGVITVGGYSVRGLLFLTWNGDLGSWSSYGPTRDGRPKPDIDRARHQHHLGQEPDRHVLLLRLLRELLDRRHAEGGSVHGHLHGGSPRGRRHRAHVRERPDPAGEHGQAAADGDGAAAER